MFSASMPVLSEKISVIMPVRDCRAFLEKTLDPVLEAIRADGNAEFIVVDNGSVDGTYEWLIEHYSSAVQVRQLTGQTIGTVRNLGAATADGGILSFLDADCLVTPQYLQAVRVSLNATGADAVGCQYELPSEPHWIEATWHALHARHDDGFVTWLPAGNLAMRMIAFQAVGGFNEELVTGEDTELCKRLRADGYRIYQSHAVAAVHLGNPKTIRRFFRRDVWYALGMHGTIDRGSIDKPTAMMLLHLLFTLAAVVAVLTNALTGANAIAALLVSQSFVPLLTVFYRLRQRPLVSGRARENAPAIARAVFLYWVYYWARIKALQVILFRQARVFRK